MTLAAGMRTDYCGELGVEHAGRKVRLCGWVAKTREHGEHLAFVDLRDRTGLVQCVVNGASDLRSEYVISVSGTVRLRPEGTENPTLPTGYVEVADCEVEVLSTAEAPPFPLSERVETDESVRLRYRYVDLRRERMLSNLVLRARVNSAIRQTMERHGFIEVETPLLWTPTPEGAREFAVPSRLRPGSFYVLPQSPQIAKQLLMVAGFDRYYQIARCLRDEDLRADRQFEFTQLDIEASFVGQDEIIGFVSEAVAEATEASTGAPPPPIETMTWGDALDRFGTDKPDLRFGMELFDLGEVLSGSELKALRAPCVKGLMLPGGGELGRARLDALVDRAGQLGAKGLVWMRVVPKTGTSAGAPKSDTRKSDAQTTDAPTTDVPTTDGLTADGLDIESPVARFLNRFERAAIIEAAGAGRGDLILAVADERRTACSVLGRLRVELGGTAAGQGPHRYVWIVEFPLFEGLDEDGCPVPAHHPFTMPHPEDLDLLETDPLAVRSRAYDLVLNGWELGSGSIRIHRADVQQKVFSALGISDEEAEARFGFLMGAFRFGAPPHGGFAFGIDRLVAILAGEENIREVIAFPKAQSGFDLMTGAPKQLSPRVLGELGIRLVAPPA